MINRNAPIVLFLLLIRYFARRSIVGRSGPEGWICRTADHVSQKLKPIWNVGRWVGGWTALRGEPGKNHVILSES